ncbi:two-component sensor histidine kinase [Nostoc sp. CENA543]|uniref:sensor histidine kinase n=1 Tax=Nostoc sp. CENA543 TaxID=1869241 RepID=UPI000CA228C4|nr:HAMP domain-containing sensor histidine kinase [Nostoc sp. CENA543]AUT03162.1 two-component sensor histidine kinase [Nostoc sp. CENA543]
MSVLEDLYKRLAKLTLLIVNPTSLHFRLTVGIVTIFALGMSSFVMWISWEIQQFLITTSQQQEISHHYARLLTVFHSLGMVNFLAIATTAIFAMVLIRKLLLPLQQINQWMGNATVSELNLYQLNFYQTPSEVKALVLACKQLLTQIQELKRQQQQFTKDLAHELRTPLSMVYAYLQRTQQRSQTLTDNQKEALAMAVLEAERMTQILQNLLDMVRASNSMMPLQPESLLLNDLVVDIAQMTQKFEHREIHLELVPFPVRVTADRNQLMQVLNHLIDNAVKYSQASELITIKLTQHRGWAIIQISDQGEGIPVSEQSRIFAPFYRVDPSRTRATGGMGLGLSIVKGLVENMDGMVAVQSEPGKGSTFTLKLPTIGAKR